MRTTKINIHSHHFTSTKPTKGPDRVQGLSNNGIHNIYINLYIYIYISMTMNVPYCTHKKPVMFWVLIQRAGEFTLPLETTLFLSARNNWRKDLVTKRKKTWMKDATCRSSRRSVQKAKRIYHGPKIRATNLEAGLPILVLWPHFWVQNLAPVLGPQNTNRSYSIRAAISKCATAAASWQQHISVILYIYI